MTMPIYVDTRTPGADDTVEWTSEVYRNDEFIWINHDTRRHTSRWELVERKRKFCVTFYRHSRGSLYASTRTYHTTSRSRPQGSRKARQGPRRHRSKGSSGMTYKFTMVAHELPPGMKDMTSKYQPGDIVRFRRIDNKVMTDTVCETFIQHTLLEPYARNVWSPALVLTDHSWCYECDVIETVEHPEYIPGVTWPTEYCGQVWAGDWAKYNKEEK